MPIRMERSAAPTADSVMYHVVTSGRNGSSRHQEIRVAWPLKGLLNPHRDIPRALQRFARINFEACPLLSRPESRTVLAEAIEVFRAGGIVVDRYEDHVGLLKDTLANVVRSVRGTEITITFRQNNQNKLYMQVSPGNIVNRRLFLGNL